MADPILHIKDGYYFEFPKVVVHHHYDKLSDVPRFLTKAYPDVRDPKEFEEAMAGKVLIPQPFGTLKNLNESASGFCISRFMVLELLVALFLMAICIRFAHRTRGGDRARGSLWNLLEAILMYVRDDMAKPAIGHHDADRFVPLLWTMFLFILTCNLMGLIPWLGTPTGAFGVTLGMAAVTFLTGLISGMRRFGPIGFWLHYVPHMDLPLLLRPIIFPLVLVLEVGGTLIRHVVLGIRLLANMAAGHLVLVSILGLITIAAETSSTGQYLTVAAVAVIGSALLSCLELFVAFLQAFVFTFLSALFIGAAIHEH
jgi:F-type H+-transporting ATPase subunit a